MFFKCAGKERVGILERFTPEAKKAIEAAGGTRERRRHHASLQRG